MKALTPVPPHSGRQVSPLTSPCLPGIPTPTTQSARWPLGQSHQRHRLLPGFATNEQARHEITPKQVRYPTDCQFASRCSPPRLAATQLRSASELRPAPARTSTVPTKRPRGAHSPPRKPGGEGSSALARVRAPDCQLRRSLPWMPAFAGMTTLTVTPNRKWCRKRLKRLKTDSRLAGAPRPTRAAPDARRGPRDWRPWRRCPSRPPPRDRRSGSRHGRGSAWSGSRAPRWRSRACPPGRDRA